MKPYYYVMRIGGDAPKYRHDTLDAAHAESLRLAKQSPGSTFEILQCLGITRMSAPTTFWVDGVTPPHDCRLSRGMNDKCITCGKDLSKNNF
jgi:hypothetical protein